MPYALILSRPTEPCSSRGAVPFIDRVIFAQTHGDLIIVITNQNSAEVAYRAYLEHNHGADAILNSAELPVIVGFWEIAERALHRQALRAVFVHEHLRRHQKQIETKERAELERLKSKYPEVP